MHDPDHSQWLMFIKDEDAKRIQLVTSKNLEGPWTLIDKNITPEFRCEGPTSVKIGDYYHVYVDRYYENHMGLIRSKDLVHWEDYSSHIKFPLHAKHGTVFKVTPELVKLISSAGL